MTFVCVPVLKRYDLLRDLLTSLAASHLEPNGVYVIDNGKNPAAIEAATTGFMFPIVVHTPDVPFGVAESWNWFIQNVGEERVIVNDDILFGPEDLGKIVATPGDIVFVPGIGFSCFLLRDSCVKKVGLFDEKISPGYGYYEDDDYLQRIDGRGTKPSTIDLRNVECAVVHRKSSTLAASTPEEVREHHRKFKIAQWNYATKWNLREEFQLL